MEIEVILNQIAKANAEESKMILDAAVHRREEWLKGGEVICCEFSKEAVERGKRIMERVRKYEEENGE